MDPYLENPLLWPGLQTGLLAAIGDLLRPFLKPRYATAIRGHTRYEMTDSSTVEWRDRFLTILDLQAKQRVVTVVKLVSPTTKQDGPGRELYLASTREALSGQVNLVEIDLLRTGRHVLSVPEGLVRGSTTCPYLMSISRATRSRDSFEIYRCTLRDSLPNVAVPIDEHSPDLVLALQTALEREYEAGCFRDRLRYERPCEPRLSPEDQAWADERIRAAGWTAPT
jgi:hypothetical protein